MAKSKSSKPVLAALKPTGTSGNFVLATQTTAGAQGFGRVSQKWYDRTKDYPWALQQIEADRRQTTDIDVRLEQLNMSAYDDGAVRVHHKNNAYQFTPYAMQQFCTKFGLSGASAYDIMMLQRNENDDQDYKWRGDRQNADLFMDYVRIMTRNYPEERSEIYLWRLNDSRKEIRACLSSQEKSRRGSAFQAIDNQWVLESLEKIIPGGRVSHWAGNPDTIRGNILVPDSLMENNGKDYMGIISFSNSEIGELSFDISPGVCVSICMNGCIHNLKKGEGVKRHHRGKGEFNYDEMFKELQEKIAAQLELIPQRIETFLNTRTLGWDGASTELLYASVGYRTKINPTLIKMARAAYDIETSENCENERTLMGLINGITRAAGNVEAQTIRGKTWTELSRAAGDMVEWTPNVWTNVVQDAMTMDASRLEKYFLAA